MKNTSKPRNNASTRKSGKKSMKDQDVGWFHAPKNVYGPNLFKIFTDELGGPARVAKLLDVTEPTVKRWMLAATQAPKDAVKVPRAAVLALYWETQYGRSAMLADHVNEIRNLYQHIQVLQAQYTRAKDIVAGLRRLDTGTANEAYFDELADIGWCPTNRHGDAAPTLPDPQTRPEPGRLAACA